LKALAKKDELKEQKKIEKKKNGLTPETKAAYDQSGVDLKAADARFSVYPFLYIYIHSNETFLMVVMGDIGYSSAI